MTTYILTQIRRLISDEKGVTAIEYGLIAALIAVAAVGAMGLVGGGLTTIFTNVSAKLAGG